MIEVSTVFWTMLTKVEPGFRLLGITAGRMRGFPVGQDGKLLKLCKERERESRGKRNEIEMEDRETRESDARENK